MKNKKIKTAFTLIPLVILFAFILQIYGCGDTKGKSSIAPTRLTPSDFLTVTSIVGETWSGGTPAELDIHIISDCDFDSTTNPPTVEPFFDDEATITISNRGFSLIDITDYRIDYTGKDTSNTIPSYVADIAVQIPGGSSVALPNVTVMKAGSSGQSGTKLWYAATYGIINTYTFGALYIFTGVSDSGASVRVSGSLEIKLGAYNYC